jgi:response regulator RpfG family c-di-GMP phosphodiesterase
MIDTEPGLAPAVVPANSPPLIGLPAALPVVRTILCVDDEPNILAAMKRLFRPTGHRVIVAESGAAALDLLAVEAVDLIISDMRMPSMNGAELLQRVRAHWPSVTRILLTGYADIASTIAAINEGQIHRYITKPWNDSELLITVKDAFDRRALQEEHARLAALTVSQNEALKQLNATLEQKVSERTAELGQANERLKKNYFNSIKTFSNLIELRGGHMVGHARKVADLARKTAKALSLSEPVIHDIFTAGLLHDIGQIGMSDHILTTPVSKLTPEEGIQYRLHPVMGEQALMGLDDMAPVAALIRSHHERWDGRGFPDGLKGDDIPMGAQILCIADAYDDLLAGRFVSGSLSPADAMTMIKRGIGQQFAPRVADAFISLFNRPPAPPPPQPLALSSEGLQPGMVLARDFVSTEGVMLLAAGHVLTEDLIKRIHAFERRSGRTVQLAILPGSGPTTAPAGVPAH